MFESHGACLISQPMTTNTLSLMAKWAQHDNRSLSSSAEVKNAWRLTSSPQMFALCNYKPSKAEWLITLPPALAISNSVLCPHSVLIGYTRF
jgi:hypothetical protein